MLNVSACINADLNILLDDNWRALGFSNQYIHIRWFDNVWKLKILINTWSLTWAVGLAWIFWPLQNAPPPVMIDGSFIHRWTKWLRQLNKENSKLTQKFLTGSCRKCACVPSHRTTNKLHLKTNGKLSASFFFSCLMSSDFCLLWLCFHLSFMSKKK